MKFSILFIVALLLSMQVQPTHGFFKYIINCFLRLSGISDRLCDQTLTPLRSLGNSCSCKAGATSTWFLGFIITGGGVDASCDVPPGIVSGLDADCKIDFGGSGGLSQIINAEFGIKASADCDISKSTVDRLLFSVEGKASGSSVSITSCSANLFNGGSSAGDCECSATGCGSLEVTYKCPSVEGLEGQCKKLFDL